MEKLLYQTVLENIETGFKTVAWIDKKGAVVGKTMTLDGEDGRFRAIEVHEPGMTVEDVKISANQARNTRKVSDV